MHRSARLTASLAFALAAAACADLTTTAPDTALVQRGPSASVIVPGRCTNLAGLNALAAPLFGPNTHPNINSVKGKLKSLDKDVKRNAIAAAKEQAYKIVQFVLKKHNQGGLSGSAAQVKAFTDAVFCFAGIDLNPLPDNNFLILPSDAPQVFTSTTGTSGVAFAANPVSEPTLLVIQTITTPLNTKLDQYPGLISIVMSSANNVPLAKPAVVGVCATGVIPQEVRDRLRLGHGRAGAPGGFEVAAAGNADFLVCPNLIADAGGQAPLWKRLASLVLPKSLHATTAMFEGGGVGGTVTEFSPFAPVDPELSFGGGVGGTVTEFIRQAPASVLFSSVVTPVDPCAAPRAGKSLDESCLPIVEIKTRLGTILRDVPVLWNVTAGGGEISPRTLYCGNNYAASAQTTTNELGRAGICWTLGAPGTNSVSATPSAGGDAPAGVTFTPEVLDFSTTAVLGPPTQISVVQGDGQVGAAGGPAPSTLIAKVTDDEGYPVPGVAVYWQNIEGGGTATPLSPTTDLNGLARANWTLGAPGANRMKAYITQNGFYYVYFNAVATSP